MFAKKQLENHKSFFVFTGIFIVLAIVTYYSGRYFHYQTLKGNKRDKEIRFLPMTLKWDYLIDFDSKPNLYSNDVLTDENARSGKYSSAINQNTGYSSIINLPIPTNDSLKLNEINFKFWLYPIKNSIDVSFIYSIFDPKQEQLFWGRLKINENNISNDVWHTYTTNFKIPGHLVDSLNVLRIYLQNHKLELPLLIDDITVSFSEEIKYKRPRTFYFDLGNNNIGENMKIFFENPNFEIVAAGSKTISEKIIIPFSKIDTCEIQLLELRAKLIADNYDINAVFVSEIIDSENNLLLKHITEVKMNQGNLSLKAGIQAEISIPDSLLKEENSIAFYIINYNNNVVRLNELYLVFKEGFAVNNNNYVSD